MAKLDAMPEQAIISAYKGIIDFYEYKGQPCARKWPHWTEREPYPDEKANQDAFAYITKHATDMPDYVIDQYRAQAAGTPWTWRDLATRAYMKGLPY
ncbi:hypothetical protein ES703_112686 [subsurface metagenome]